MKKRILGIALITLSLVSFAGVAQNNNNANTTKQEKVCSKKGDRKDMKARPNPFDGLQLSDAQKTKIQQLDEKRKAERQQMKEDRKEHRKAEANKDATARREAQKAYLNEVKSILTPEQYVSFLENSYMQKGGMKHDHRKASFGKRQKGEKAGVVLGRESRANNSDKARAEKKRNG